MVSDSPNTPKVSIILPAYNHAHFLPQSIESALGQTDPDFEVIVVDDGSTDDTREVVSGYSDPRIRYLYQENRGLAAARNTGLRAARGEFVAFLDADDLFLPNKLELQTRYFSNHKAAGLVAGGWKYIDADGKWIGEYWPWPHPPELNVYGWLENCFVNPVSVLVRKQYVEQAGGFDENLKQVEDWDLWLRLAYAGCRMGWVESFVCAYRFSPHQMTRNATQQKQASIQVLDKFFAQSDLPEHYRDLLGLVYSRLYRLSAGREFAAGQPAAARDSIEQAACYQPELRGNWTRAQVAELLEPIYFPGFTRDPLDHVAEMFTGLPAGLQARRRWAFGEVGMRSFYAAHQRSDWPEVRRAAKVVLQNAPQRLVNRGVLSILWQSWDKDERDGRLASG